MEYGAMNFPIKPVLDEIEEFAALGFNYLELTMDAPQAHYQVVRRELAAIRRQLNQNGMKVVCHMPTFVFTADLTPSIRNASLEEVCRSLETAADLEAEKIVLHPSVISGLGPLVKAQAVAYAEESLDTVLQLAGRLGLNICLENMFPRLGYMVAPQEFIPVLESYPEINLTIDTGHAFIGKQNTSRILDFITQFPSRIHHIHISDNHGRRDDHLPLGQGAIDFATVIRALQAHGYNGTMTLEIFTENRQDLVASREVIEKLLEDGMDSIKT